MRKQVSGMLSILLTSAFLFSACDNSAELSSQTLSAGSNVLEEYSSPAVGNMSQFTSSGTADPFITDSSDQSSSVSNISSNPNSSAKSSAPAVPSKNSSSPPKKTSSAAAPVSPPAAKPSQTYTGTITVKTPTAPGKVVYQEGGATIDASNASEGYIMVKCVSSAPRLKLQIKYGGYTYNYDLNKEGRFEVFPLQGGSTEYTVRVMENVSSTRYRQLYAAVFTPQMANADAPYLYPSQYVNFSASSQAVKKSYDLCVNAKTDLQKIEAIYTYITQNISYDTGKAEQVKAGQLSGYIPNVDSILKSRKGICFDYAALMAAMLRAQNIPAKMAIGTVAPGNLSHSWNLVYTKEKGWIAFKIEFTGGKWKLMDSTFGASKGQTIEQYIGNGSNYTQLRVY